MSNICKTVTLRTRKIKGGEQLSYYLDYYPGYRDESTMKVMRHESLKYTRRNLAARPFGTLFLKEVSFFISLFIRFSK